jgi:hypothetical protein
MGFYITIYQLTPLCRVTGTPFYYNNFEVKYGTLTVTVPEEYRRFLYEKNSAYRQYMVDDQQCSFVDDICEQFPSWEDVLNQLPENIDWDENDHNLFYEAVKWFSSQPEKFIATFG